MRAGPTAAGLLKKNVLIRQPWATREELPDHDRDLDQRTHRRRSRQDFVHRFTHIQFETIMTTQATKAA